MRRLLLAVIGIACARGVARAEWEDWRVPEGANAYTVKRHDLRLDLIGRSAFGITSRVELSTYLLLDAVLFPNLGLKVRVADTPRVAVAVEGHVGGGLYPVAGGGLLPFPPVAFGSVGFVAASFQLIGTQVTVHPAHALAFTLRGNLIAAEAKSENVGGVVGPGAAAALPFAFGGSSVGASGGAEVDWVLGKHDTLVLEADVAGFRHAREQLSLAWIGWTHGWKRFHLTVGAYTIVDLPDAKMLHDKEPVAPFGNVYWKF